MAPIQVSPPSAPSGVFSVFASIGDRQQIIVYAAIAIILFAIFLFAVIYILRQYNASSQDEESHTTSTPRPPLRLLLPGMTQQRTSSSASTLVECVTPPRNSPASSKREGSIPSPL
ncbi:uncharacterized protein B0H18DRAFT_1212525, partial [Fomitopsis serialis]|uniref:uncharacterized protein n=1 Tax=Fomitopsis serialis TaxID=139415 RepID=UPI002007C369